MATLPTECPKCRKPIEPAHWSRGTDFSANILIPAQCSGAPACDWEDSRMSAPTVAAIASWTCAASTRRAGSR